MKIWQLRSKVDDFDNLIAVKSFTAEEIQSFDGRSHKETWGDSKSQKNGTRKRVRFG